MEIDGMPTTFTVAEGERPSAAAAAFLAEWGCVLRLVKPHAIMHLLSSIHALCRRYDGNSELLSALERSIAIRAIYAALPPLHDSVRPPMGLTDGQPQ